MHLRARLLGLVALSLSLALSCALWMVQQAASSQAHQQLQQRMEAQIKSWERLRTLYLESLQAEAAALAREPGLARVLRARDRATLDDYLSYRLQTAPRTLHIQLRSPQGKLLGSTAAQPPFGKDSGPLLELAGREGPVAGFELQDGRPYLAAAAAVENQGRGLVALVWVGLPLDSSFLDKLEQDLGCRLRLIAQTSSPSSVEASLRSPLEDAEGQLWGWLEVVGDLSPLRQFLSQLRAQLLGLGLAVVGGGVLLALPWIRQTAQPVEEGERARANLQAVISASLDGILALDHQGRVTIANPAAAVLLGRSLENCCGQSLQSLLPEEVWAQLIAQPPGAGPLVQSCNWQRPEGQIQLTRNFLAEGSLVTFRDRSQQDQVQQAFQRTLEQLGPWLAEARGSALQQRRLVANLLVLSGARPGQPPATDLASLQQSCPDGLGPLGPTEWEFALGPQPGQLAVPAWALEVVLLNLVDNAYRHGETPVRVSIRAELGGCWLEIRDGGGWTLGEWSRHYPQGGQQRGPGLGLAAVRQLLDEVECRHSQSKGVWKLWFPAVSWP